MRRAFTPLAASPRYRWLFCRCDGAPMSEKHFFSLLNELWGDFQHPNFLWEVFALALILAVSWWLSFMLRARERAHHKLGRSALSAFGIGSLKRMAFPLVALVFVLILRKVLRSMQWDHLSLLDLAVPLLVSWALVRILVYVLRCVFSDGGFLTSFERWLTFAIWVGVVLNITGLDDSVIEMLEQVNFRVGKQTLDLWM